MENILNAVLLATARRSVEHTETVAAAPSASTATGVELVFRPDLPHTGTDEYVVLSRIAAQGIIPTDVSIKVRDLNRRNNGAGVAVPLPPSLVINDLVFVGNVAEGITVTIQNRRQQAVPITFYVATITDAQFEAMFGRAVPKGWS